MDKNFKSKIALTVAAATAFQGTAMGGSLFDLTAAASQRQGNDSGETVENLASLERSSDSTKSIVAGSMGFVTGSTTSASVTVHKLSDIPKKVQFTDNTGEVITVDINKDTDWTMDGNTYRLTLNSVCDQYTNIDDEIGNMTVNVELKGIDENDNQPVIPGNKNITQYTDNNDRTKVTIMWERADDDYTPKGSLKYYVYKSEGRGYNTIEEWEDNAQLVREISDSSICGIDVTGLNPLKDNYFKVIVEDGAGNKSAYNTELKPAYGGEPWFPTRWYASQIRDENDGTKLKLTWEKAVDDTTPSEELKYYVYKSVNNNYDSIEEWENKGILLNPGGTVDINEINVTGLNYDDDYFFKVIVEDKDGKKAELASEGVGSISYMFNKYLQYIYDEVNERGFTENTDVSSIEEMLGGNDLNASVTNFQNKDGVLKFTVSLRKYGKTVSKEYSVKYRSAVSKDENNMVTVEGVKYKVTEDNQLILYKVPNDAKVIILPEVNVDGELLELVGIDESAFEGTDNMQLIDFSQNNRDMLLEKLGNEFKVVYFYTGSVDNENADSSDSNADNSASDMGRWMCAFLCRNPENNKSVLGKYMSNPSASGYVFTGWKMIINNDNYYMVAQWSKKSTSSGSGSSSSGGGSSSGSGSSSTADTTASSNTESTNTSSGSENVSASVVSQNIAGTISNNVGGQVISKTEIKTANGGNAVSTTISIGDKKADIIASDVSDKISVPATEKTKAYIYVEALGSYMPIEAAVADGKMTIDAVAGVPYVVSADDIAQSVVEEGWNKVNDTWYVVKDNGSLATGWYNDNGTWYNLSDEGKMNTGWIKDSDGRWYMLNANGAMKTGWLLDNDGKWYMLDKNSGEMKTGWFNDDNGKWYYLNSNGAMASDTVVDGYVLGADGAWIE